MVLKLGSMILAAVNFLNSEEMFVFRSMQNTKYFLCFSVPEATTINSLGVTIPFKKLGIPKI